MIKVLILTSSRADFGVYMPLLNVLKYDKEVDLKILAFGTHVSRFHGYSLDHIQNIGYSVDYRISSFLVGDEAVDIATCYSLTSLKFADFWASHENVFDWVVVLGDRFEMAAAVASGVPFNMNFAHIHAGETTLGAIDNIYRHSITLASKIQFVALPEYKEKVKQLFCETESSCEVVGALSLDNLKEISLLSIDEFKNKWHVDLSLPSILVTVHPETMAYENNQYFADQLYESLLIIAKRKQLIITMPNADTSGTVFREIYKKLQTKIGDKVKLIENLGTQSYFTCMAHVGLLLGNTSSGIIEAASFRKYVLNLGGRQKGRITSDNIIHLPFDKNDIVNNVSKYFDLVFDGENTYYKGGAANKIIAKLKEYDL